MNNIFFASSGEAKKAGWFSRRHRTSAARDKARAKHAAKRADKLARARKRTEEAQGRSPHGARFALDLRLGDGAGAKNERERLQSKILS